MSKEVTNISIIVILLVIMLSINIVCCKNKEYYIDNNDNLYDNAVRYIYENNDDSNRNEYKYNLFVDYEGFGITKDKEYKYVYLWINKQAYYVQDNKIIIGSGSSIPYKFRLDENNCIIDYEIPNDGNEYAKSIKEMFPNDIENKVLNYSIDDSEMIKEVKEYYSELKDTNIYAVIEGEYKKIA